MDINNFKIYHNLNSINKILNLNSDKFFLVTGKNSFAKLKNKFSVLSKLEKKSVVFNDFSINPKWEDVKKGVCLFEKDFFQFIIAIGGGSVIDIAKLIKYYGDQKKINLLAIPTTAGSGSESTRFAVLYKRQIKYSISNISIKPNYIILDQELLKTQSLNQLSISALDAISQSIESLWSINSTTETTKISTKGLINSFNGILSIINNKIDYKKLMIGSNYAGKAIDITKTTGPHAISYYFTTKFGLPHGFSVAYTVPFFMIENYKFCYNNEEFKTRFDKIFHCLNSTNIIEGALIFLQLIKDLPIEEEVKNFNFSKVNIIDIEKKVNHERLKNNPANLNFNSLREYFKSPIKWIKS